MNITMKKKTLEYHEKAAAKEHKFYIKELRRCLPKAPRENYTLGQNSEGGLMYLDHNGELINGTENVRELIFSKWWADEHESYLEVREGERCLPRDGDKTGITDMQILYGEQRALACRRLEFAEETFRELIQVRRQELKDKVEQAELIYLN